MKIIMAVILATTEIPAFLFLVLEWQKACREAEKTAKEQKTWCKPQTFGMPRHPGGGYMGGTTSPQGYSERRFTVYNKVNRLGRPVKKELNRLWSSIPDVYTYREYISLMNEIDWARQDRLISAREEEALTGCLNYWAKIMQIPTTSEEYDQMYR